MNYSDLDRLKMIIRLWEELSGQIKQREITPEQLLRDSFIQWAVTTPLYNIGEQVYQLSPEFKQKHSDISWNTVSGLRHRLVHNYEGINWSIIVEIVFHEMDDFIREMKEIAKKPVG